MYGAAAVIFTTITQPHLQGAGYDISQSCLVLRTATANSRSCRHLSATLLLLVLVATPLTPSVHYSV